MGVLVAVLILHAVPAAAQFDHLQCWKIKVAQKTKGYVDLAPLEAQLPENQDCKIVGPKLFCAPVHKTIVDVSPAPIGAPDGPEPGAFFCYKAKCDVPPSPLTASDQFASYQVEFKKSFLLCAPVTEESTTTTTTSSSTTSTTLVCTADVKQCPDGSSVERDPLNNCEFARCPGDCVVDEDCRVYPSFCPETPCQCLATGVADPDPVCSGPDVLCITDPCLATPSSPVCNDSGRCQAVPN